MAAAKTIQPQATKETKVLQHDRQLVCCRYSRYLRFLYAAGFDGLLHRWELKSAKHAAFPAPGGWIESMALHPAKPELFTADSWGTVHCWPLDKDKLTPRWTIKKAHKTWLRRLAISPDGERLATCGDDRLVRIFSTADGKPLQTLKGHQHHVQSVAFHPGGKHLASGDLHGVVKHWEISTGRHVRDMVAAKLFRKIREYEQGGVRTMTFDTGGNTLYCAGFEGTTPNQGHGKPTVVAFDWKSGKPRATLTPKAAFAGPILDVVYHPAGYLIGAGSSEAGGALWFWKAGETTESHFVKNKTSFRGLALHQDGVHLAATAFGDRGGQRGGNGRRLNKKGEYVGFAGNIVLYELKTGS